jgi:hypothetical protein
VTARRVGVIEDECGAFGVAADNRRALHRELASDVGSFDYLKL